MCVWSLLIVAALVGGCCSGTHPAKPPGLDEQCNPGDPPCPQGLSCLRLFDNLSPPADGGPGPPNDFTCRLSCSCDDQCPDGYYCLTDVPHTASNVCVVQGLKLPG
ncbi:MAG TPA: hypothetical protein VKN99_08305 [Polyangia bacterium]|nr:hypothetical protein [Polyangia bacterium]